jgi:hypothetical protein
MNDKPVLVDVRGIFGEEETEKVGFYYGRLRRHKDIYGEDNIIQYRTRDGLMR